MAGPLGPLEHTDEQLSSRIRFIGHTGRMTRPRGGATIFEGEVMQGGRCGSELHFNIIDMPAAIVEGL